MVPATFHFYVFIRCVNLLHGRDWKQRDIPDLTFERLLSSYGKNKKILTEEEGFITDGEANKVAKAVKNYSDKGVLIMNVLSSVPIGLFFCLVFLLVRDICLSFPLSVRDALLLR